ncbi:MAG: protein translocase subunit SecD [Actinomycetota bacterium]
MRRTRRYLISVFVVALAVGLSIAGLTFFNARPKLGLDLQGGLSVVLTATGEVEEGILDQTVEIIRNRVDSLGAQEPDISRSGTENIIVQLPGIRDRDRALEIIGKTAQLRFREVLDAGTPEDAKGKGWKLSTTDTVDEEVIFPSAESDVWYSLGKAELVGSDVDGAQANFDETSSGWRVDLEFTNEGAEKFAAVTGRLAASQGQLAIVLDQIVESAPGVEQAIPDGRGVITGQFTEQEAKDLALVLKTGALPIELEQSQVDHVSATLGSASLRSGLIAGVIGLVLVAAYMLLFYRLLGLVTLLGLGVFAVIILGLIGAISTYRGFSLTLAGVAGLIVSVGIAADSYIIYYERVKDELKEGKTLRSSVERGYRSALSTNLAANGVAFAAAIILWAVAVGPVRGFALTLGVSVLLDVILLNFFTHPIVGLLSNWKFLTGYRALGVRDSAPAGATS